MQLVPNYELLLLGPLNTFAHDVMEQYGHLSTSISRSLPSECGNVVYVSMLPRETLEVESFFAT